MEYNNKKHNQKFKKSSSKEGVICFKIKEARGTGWLSFNDLKLWKIPCEVYTRLLNLHHLYMSRCKLTGDLPVEMGYLTQLEVLDISLNKVTGIPDNLLANMAQLRVLDVSGNLLRSLPYTVECLESLQELCASQNELVAVPHTLGRLQQLKILDLSYNMIGHLQPEMFCGGIEINLRKLYLQNNLLDRIPRELGRLQRLVELDVSNNQMYFLPTTAKSLFRLQVLRHSGNKWCNPEPKYYYESFKSDEQLDSSFGSTVHNKLRTLVYPAVL